VSEGDLIYRTVHHGWPELSTVVNRSGTLDSSCKRENVNWHDFGPVSVLQYGRYQLLHDVSVELGSSVRSIMLWCDQILGQSVGGVNRGGRFVSSVQDQLLLTPKDNVDQHVRTKSERLECLGRSARGEIERLMRRCSGFRPTMMGTDDACLSRVFPRLLFSDRELRP
jgi:hypothetical protein